MPEPSTLTSTIFVRKERRTFAFRRLRCRQLFSFFGSLVLEDSLSLTGSSIPGNGTGK